MEKTKSSTKVAGIEASKTGFVEPMFATDSINSNIVRNEVGAMVEEIVLTDSDIKETLS